jgi:hypothetical protein
MRKLLPEEIGVLELPTKLRKSPPKEFGQHKSPISCVVAATASTLVYSLAYGQAGTASTKMPNDLTGSDASATLGSNDDAGSEECKSDFFDEDYLPNGLTYSDDEDIILVGIDPDSKDEFEAHSQRIHHATRLLFLADLNRQIYQTTSNLNLLQLGSCIRRTAKHTWTRSMGSVSRLHSLIVIQEEKVYFGGNSDQLRPMTKVESHPLVQQQTFSSKDIVQLCIAEETNLQGNTTKISRSDYGTIIVVGVDSYMRTTFSKVVCWMV